jgi:hypothetical protein
VAVDLNDRGFDHSLDDLQSAVFAAEGAGYPLVAATGGILVYRRPKAGAAPPADPLARWRVSEADARRLAALEGVPVVASGADVGLRVAAAAVRPAGAVSDDWQKIELQAVLQATRDDPQECLFRHTVLDTNGRILADKMAAPVGGNRPTNWWRKGEAWVQRDTLLVPADVDPGGITQRFEFRRVSDPAALPGGSKASPPGEAPNGI